MSITGKSVEIGLSMPDGRAEDAMTAGQLGTESPMRQKNPLVVVRGV